MKYLVFFTCFFLSTGFTIAFIPGIGRQFVDWSSITHRVITRAGLWATVLEFLETNPEYEDKNQVSKHFLSSLERQGLFEGQIPHELFGYIRSSKFENAVREIEKANEAVDTIEEELTAAHVDAEQFLRSSRRLVTLKRMVISLINKTDANENSYAAARKETGRLLHTLQDFYSHSNWIEAGNKEPLKILGDKIIRQEYVAGKDQKTCNDCTPATWLRLFFPVDDCENNLIPNLGKLTSGYTGQEEVVKPPSVGKCSHGGLIDKSRYVHSTGGINKDASKRYLSPHYRLHKLAASVAINATKLFFDSVRAAVGDKLFAKYLSMKAVNTLSLAFDTTGNMNDEIAGVQKATAQFIEDSAAAADENDLHYVLVPFNGNPEFGPAYVTRDAKAAKEKVNSLKASGKPGKHSKLGMNSLYLALTHSLPKSDVYYFSDDSAKKAHLSLPVLSLALEKQCRIHSFISGDTSSRRRKRRDLSGGRTLHESLATTTGGQLIEYEKSSVDNAIKFVRRPVVSAGNKSLVLQEVSLYAAVEVKNVLSTMGKVYDVKSDSSIVSMTIVLSADEKPHINVIPPQDNSRTANITIITQTSTVYSVRITHPVAGNWRFNITATGSYSLHVRAQSNLAFSTSLQRKGVSQKAFSTISGHPIKGQKLFVTVVPSQQNILLPEKNLTAYVIDPAGNKLDNFELERGQLLYDNAYYGSIVMNFDAVKLMYIGHSTTGETVQRLLSRLIKPQEFVIKLKRSTRNSSLVLSPDEITSFNVTLYNYGPRQRFTIQASDGGSFVTSYKPKFATLNSNDSIDIQIDLRAPVNTNDGTTSFLSIAASVPSSSGAAHDKANFISLPFSVFSKEFLFINETELGDANLTEFLSPHGKKQNNTGDGFPINVIILIAVGAVIAVAVIVVAAILQLGFARKKKSTKSGRGTEGSGLINNDYA